MESLLTEDEVIDSVIDYLKQKGWAIKARSHVDEHGEDIVAARRGTNLIVEAKGAGSFKQGTSRYGLPFSRGQVFDHVGKAILKALRVVGHDQAVAGVAFPDNSDHRREISQVSVALQHL